MAAHRRALAFLLSLLVPPAFAASPPGAGKLDAGREIYTRNCAECHGEKGRGDGPTATKRHFLARDFSHGSFKCRCTATGELPTDDDLRRTVRDGLAGTPMVGFADTLSPSEIDAVIAHVKSFSKHFASAPEASCLPVPEPPAADATSLAEGRHIYHLLQCWKCHGLLGRGDGPSAATLADDWGMRSRPGRFGETGKLKCGGGAKELYRTIHTGLDGSPMPSYETAFLFAREAGSDLRAFAKPLGAAATAELSDWLALQPDATALLELPPEARAKLTEARTWALVHYLLSLPPSGLSGPSR